MAGAADQGGTTRSARPRVVVVGAGAAGTLTAIHLLRAATRRATALEIVLVDPADRWGRGVAFGTPDETALTENESSPLFVHHFPTAIKAFYMEPDAQEPEYCLSVDMLAPEGYGEVIGGSQRIWDLYLLETRIKDHNLPRDAFEWYLDLRRYGSVPHGGFGMGIERVVSWICGLDHLREAIPFPRMLNRLTP